VVAEFERPRSEGHEMSWKSADEAWSVVNSGVGMFGIYNWRRIFKRIPQKATSYFHILLIWRNPTRDLRDLSLSGFQFSSLEEMMILPPGKSQLPWAEMNKVIPKKQSWNSALTPKPCTERCHMFWQSQTPSRWLISIFPPNEKVSAICY
jgi:hypothetical protein